MEVASFSLALASGSSIECKSEDDGSLGGQPGVNSFGLCCQPASSKFSHPFASVEVHHPPPSSSHNPLSSSPHVTSVEDRSSTHFTSRVLLPSFPHFASITDHPSLVFPLWVSSLCRLASPHLVMFYFLFFF